MATSYPKRGKKGSRPGSGAGNQGIGSESEKIGHPYHYRHEMGSSEVRSRELYDNDYGKTAAPQPQRGGRAVSMRPTIITAS
jgi:hypothetical protein